MTLQLILVIILISTIIFSFAYAEKISDQIKSNAKKFYYFDSKLLDLIDSGQIDKYSITIILKKPLKYSNQSTEQQTIQIISNILQKQYGAESISVRKNMLGVNIDMVIPVKHLPQIAKLKDVGAILAGDSPYIKNTKNMTVSQKITNNPKFSEFSPHLLQEIDNGNVDVLSVNIAVALTEWDNQNKQDTRKKMEQLISALQDKHKAYIPYPDPQSTYLRALVPVKELPDIGDYSFVKRIEAKHYSFKYLSSDKNKGILKVSGSSGHLYDIPYVAKNATVLSGSLMGIDVNSQKGGSVEISFPREMIDRNDHYGFLTLKDWENPYLHPKNSTPKSIIINDIEKNCDYRKIRFDFPNGYKGSIAFHFPFWTDGAPYLDEYNKYIREFRLDNFTITNEGKKFVIKTDNGGAVCSVDFVPQEKKIHIIKKGFYDVTPYLSVTIPNDLLDEPFEVLVKGKKIPFTLGKGDTESNIIPELTPALYDNGTNKIVLDIIGSVR